MLTAIKSRGEHNDGKRNSIADTDLIQHSSARAHRTLLEGNDTRVPFK